MSGGFRFASIDVMPQKWQEQARKQISPREPETKRSKFSAVKTIVDGLTFDSKREAKRYTELAHMQRAGEISMLRTQVRFQCHVNGELICTYFADFAYRKDGREIVEDVKGYRKGKAYEMFRLKKKLVNACCRVDVQEIS